MDMARIERARALERRYDRRTARARRSGRLGAVLFSLTGLGMVLMLRMNPAIVGDVVAWSHGTNRTAAPPTLSAPPEIHVSRMPGDVVPVRRAGTLPGNDARAPHADTQARADAVGDALRGLSPGG